MEFIGAVSLLVLLVIIAVKVVEHVNETERAEKEYNDAVHANAAKEEPKLPEQ